MHPAPTPPRKKRADGPHAAQRRPPLPVVAPLQAPPPLPPPPLQMVPTLLNAAILSQWSRLIHREMATPVLALLYELGFAASILSVLDPEHAHALQFLTIAHQARWGRGAGIIFSLLSPFLPSLRSRFCDIRRYSACWTRRTPSPSSSSPSPTRRAGGEGKGGEGKGHLSPPFFPSLFRHGRYSSCLQQLPIAAGARRTCVRFTQHPQRGPSASQRGPSASQRGPFTPQKKAILLRLDGACRTCAARASCSNTCDGPTWHGPTHDPPPLP